MGEPNETSRTPMKVTKRIVWRLPVVMAERGIYKRNKLQQMLQDIGIELSTVQVGRIFNEPPDSFKKSLLEGLMTVLGCSLTDLLVVEDVGPDEEQGNSGGTATQTVGKPVVQVDRKPPPLKMKTVPSHPDVQGGPPAVIKLTGPYDLKNGPRLGALPRPKPKE